LEFGLSHPASVATPALDESIRALSFEQAMKELEDIVRAIETGSADLEASLQAYTRGTALQQHCQNKLAEARLRVESIIKSEHGTRTVPFETTSE
jgi:exodeoxyribonuclease VII small subunit